MKIPLSKPFIEDKDKIAVLEVLESGWLASGKKTKEFEKDFAKYIQVKEAVAVNSCTSALFLTLKALNINKEVIIPSFTFSATANAVITAGATPVFADIEFFTNNISPEEIEKKITNYTEAIIPVHFAGQSCNMRKIKRIAREYDLELIEDSAEAIGSTFESKKTGSFGIGCFSFFPTKNMTTGEGGMITTNNTELAEKLRLIRGHGIKKNKIKWFRDCTEEGYNFRMTDFQAALGITQLRKLDKMNNLRRKHAKYLNKNMRDIKEIHLPIEETNCRHTYQMYTIKLGEHIDRNKFVESLNRKGIGASVHFDPPVHLQTYYKDLFPKVKLPVTERVSKTILSLPMYPELKKEQLDYMIKEIRKITK